MKRVVLSVVCTVVAAGLSMSVAAAEGDWDAVAKALGRSGTELPGGIYRVGLGRSDLKVTLDGVQIRPTLALGSYLAFQKMGSEAMVMGDLVLLQEEVNPVMKKLVEGGIGITALHNHLLRSQPFTMYMHFEGHGDPAKLATALRTALAESKTPLAAPAGGGKAAITGDFVLIAKEVNPVLKTLRDNGIEVTALHSHMLEEQPRLFFMHFWANDDAQKLAGGLKTALDKVNRGK